MSVTTKIEEAVQLVEDGDIQAGLDQLHALQQDANHQQKHEIAELYIKWGLLDEAKVLIDELLLLYPEEGQLYIDRADIALDLENEEEALEYLMEVPESDPAYLQALFLMADLYQVQGLDEVAEQKLLEAKKKAPNELLVDFGLGEFYLSRGDYKKSIPYYENVLKEHEQIGSSNVHLCLAEALSTSGQFEKALEHYEKGLSQKTELHALFGYGFAAYQVEHYGLAIAKWSELLELEADYPSLYLYLARAYEHEELVDEALNTVKKGIELDGLNKELLLAAGKLSIKQQNPEEAEEYLREAISVDPGYIEAVTTLTKFFVQHERFEEIIDTLEHVIEFGEYDPQFDWDLAHAKNQIEEFSDALKHYENAYTSFKNNPTFLEEYGSFMLEEGRRDEAKKAFKRALEIDPSLTHLEEELMRLEEW
ncbi:tetratricopeptide repeat protein [Bacillus tianshenii]|nr:tetratricopeptide repeat protein [Bacillus tianshenii]